jgi:hypothetical protein
MAFILAGDGRDDDVDDAFRRYQDYLRSVRKTFPPSAYALATSEWYFDFHDHRCPHDAWLETTCLFEPFSGQRSEVRSQSMKVRLLGAYHDGHIELRYPRLFAYTLNVVDAVRGHRDWRYDELRLSDRGNLVHEIEWWGPRQTGSWVIEASDVEFLWIPKSLSNPA